MMKGKINIVILTVLIVVINQIVLVYGYSNSPNTNLSGGLIVILIPAMIGIVYLAKKVK